MEKHLIERLIDDGHFHIFYVRPKPARCVSCGDVVIRPWVFSCDGCFVEVTQNSVLIRDLNDNPIVLDRDSITEVQRYDVSKRLRQ